MIDFILIILPTAWLLYLIFSFVANYRRVIKLKLPIIPSPINPLSPLWMIAQKYIGPICHALPFHLGSFIGYNRTGWEYHEQLKLHLELGDAWVYVSTGKNQLMIADAEAIEDILSRRQDFQKPVFLYQLLEIFGANVDTVEGREWQRHRKITAPPFNEKNSGLVWVEALKQAKQMLDWWTCNNREGVKTLDEDAKILSLHVLTSAGLGISYPFQSARDPPQAHFSMTYRDALALVLEHLLVLLAVPPKIFSLPLIPHRWARVGQATREFRKYMTKMLQKEKDLVFERSLGTGNLMSSLVRESEKARKAVDEKQTSEHERTTIHEMRGLTDDEILGNIFLYIFAGHETTGNVLTYSILLLAAYPQWQEWIAEEVDYLIKDQQPTGTWEYKVFPKLKRCLAIMLETLRLYSPVTAIPKYTNDRAQRLRINDKEMLIPADTIVLLSLVAMHTKPQNWGEDSLVWRPSRWIVSSEHTCDDINFGFDDEIIMEPRNGTYFPWSGGARNCPGKKFAQVEFVAVMSTLFRSHRVRPVIKDGETEGEARQRIALIVADSELGLTLHCRKPSQALLQWVNA